MNNTFAWWDTVANWMSGMLNSTGLILMDTNFKDTAMNSPLCESARRQYGQVEGRNSIIRLDQVINNAHQVLVDASVENNNNLNAWPFLTYLHNNPDNFEGLGPYTLQQMFSKLAPLISL
jgi:hypothetical protein